MNPPSTPSIDFQKHPLKILLWMGVAVLFYLAIDWTVDLIDYFIKLALGYNQYFVAPGFILEIIKVALLIIVPLVVLSKALQNAKQGEAPLQHPHVPFLTLLILVPTLKFFSLVSSQVGMLFMDLPMDIGGKPYIGFHPGMYSLSSPQMIIANITPFLEIIGIIVVGSLLLSKYNKARKTALNSTY